MCDKTLKFGDFEANKNEFHASKKAVALNLVEIDKIISAKFKHSNKGFKYFIGQADDNIIRSLCISLPQMSGHRKYFGNYGKNMPFKIGHDNVLVKYNKIWNKIKKVLNIKFHSNPVYGEKYVKTKVKTFNKVVNTNFQVLKF